MAIFVVMLLVRMMLMTYEFFRDSIQECVNERHSRAMRNFYARLAGKGLR
jgi:uncharacterized membrane protein